MLRNKVLFFEFDVITAEYISNKMLANTEKLNLNMIGHNSIVKLVSAVTAQGFKIKEICLSPQGNADKYKTNLLQSIDCTNIQLNMVTKADSQYKVVNAACVIAKVKRDEALKKWKFVEDISNK